MTSHNVTSTKVGPLVACGAALIIPTLAYGQPPANPSPTQVRAFSSLVAPANLPLGTLPGTEIATTKQAVSEILLEGTESEGVASAAIGWTRGSESYRLKFSSPINKSTREATLLTLEDGLAAGATAEFSLSHLQWPNASEADMVEFEKLCTEAGKGVSCDIDELPFALRSEGRRLLRMDAPPMYFGLTASASRRDFSFLDDVLDDQKESHTSGFLTARIGRFSQRFGFAFLSYAYEQRYQPAGVGQEICRPLGTSEASVCEEAILGAPSKRIGSVLRGELRRYLGAALAVSPSISYDFKADVTALAVPIYFLRNKEGGLTGGVRATWRSDTENLAFIVFVGTSFSLQ